MTTTDDLRRARPARPRVVTVSVVLWLVWLLVGVASTVLVWTSGAGLTGIGDVIALVLSLVVWAAVAWAVVRVLRGSARARFVLVVIAALRAALSLTNGAGALVVIALSVAAAVPLFLPSARPWFRAAGHRGRAPGATGGTEPHRASRPDPDRH